ncbi:uncharacterized protein F5147DRAFT_701769 [Suillus discolor]|uniref:Uncharacterized protein n=1 Tax=Suillus discolor TaxID=1912936 RepID=A0A9P7F3W7_9AGAM|nr:uncharacterized protein F5147DRAFT_701769 [Suillus discolor]KAG2105761.1 hypothetical protein F5147DRAFT_701769 [Suillus discolor]
MLIRWPAVFPGMTAATCAHTNEWRMTVTCMRVLSTILSPSVVSSCMMLAGRDEIKLRLRSNVSVPDLIVRILPDAAADATAGV